MSERNPKHRLKLLSRLKSFGKKLLKGLFGIGRAAVLNIRGVVTCIALGIACAIDIPLKIKVVLIVCLSLLIIQFIYACKQVMTNDVSMIEIYRWLGDKYNYCEDYKCYTLRFIMGIMDPLMFFKVI